MSRNWAGGLVEAAGGYEIDPILLMKLLSSNGKFGLSDSAVDAVKLIALVATDEGRNEVAEAVREYALAYQDEDGRVDAGSLCERIGEWLS